MVNPKLRQMFRTNGKMLFHWQSDVHNWWLIIWSDLCSEPLLNRMQTDIYLELIVNPMVKQMFRNDYITKTCLYNFDPLKPHFYIVKLGFTGVDLIFLFLLKNIDCGYLLEPPHWGGSNEYPQSMFWAEAWKISEFFYLNIFIFWL